MDRYGTREMAEIWCDGRRFGLMARVAALAAEAQRGGRQEVARLKRVAERLLESPKAAETFAAAVRDAEIGDSPGRAGTRHETAAFLEVLARRAKARRSLQLGLTSSDLLDTALAVQMRDAAGVLLAGTDILLGSVRRLARRHAGTVMVGRTHGMHAEPITFGIKVAGWYDSIRRVRAALAEAREMVSVGKLSGAVGTYAHLEPLVEARVCRRLGLRPVVAAGQVVPRELHAIFLLRAAILASVLERIATEIRHLQRSEVREVEEPFVEGQIGSSAMPHKRNPVRSERVCGLARIVRGLAGVSLENVALWHERDMSHSSAERVTLPGVTTTLHFMLREAADIVGRLRVFPDRMRRNLEATGGLVYSETVMLALVRSGLTRRDAYARVQALATRAWEGDEPFRTLVEQAPEIRRRFSPAEIARWFDPSPHLRHAQLILRRAGVV